MFNLFNKRIIAVFTAAAVIIVLHYFGALTFVEDGVAYLLKPVERVIFRSGAAAQSYYGDKTDRRDLSAVNRRLEVENQRLITENIKLKVLEDENKALREQINFYSRRQYQKVVANIISRQGTGRSSQIIILDKGGRDGVMAGQAVIAGDGIIVGKIFSVANDLSYAYLLTDERCQVAASLAGEEDVSGIARGDLGLTVRMDFIPQGKNIQSGQIIVTSGLEPAIPKGLIIGSVQETESENNNLFQSAVINPLVNLSALSIVSIIIN